MQNNSDRDKQIRRILIVDDNESIHEDFKNILLGTKTKSSELESLEHELFGDEAGGIEEDAFAGLDIKYEIDDAYQGEEAMEMVDRAIERGRPYALVFMDVRMPPGIDGIQTIRNIWHKHKHIEMVICTAFADYTWNDITAMFGQTDHLLFVKKPFISVEVKQIALTLTTKWQIDKEKQEYMADLEKKIEQVKKSKALLKKKEQEYRNLYETAAIGLYRCKISDGKLLRANKTALRAFGYSNLENALADEFTIADCYPAEKRSNILASATESDDVSRVETHLTFKDEREMDAVITFKIYPDENYIEGAIQDVTEARRQEKELAKKEQQLIQAQKMETVGTLAGGLAHDFNNVLGGIIGTVSLIEFAMQTKKDLSQEKITNHVDIIKQSANRAADMVRQLLTLSRKQELCLAPVDLNLSVQMVMKLCKNSFDKSIALEEIYFEKPAMVFADPTQVEQALLNLCVNASHAMTIMREEGEVQGGVLSVDISCIEAEKHFIKGHPEAAEGAYWLIKVCDTGIGMEPWIMAKIFDPFFTTKERQRGSGLGLAMVHNILKQHKGFVDVYSEIGKGTCFDLFFPVMEDSEEAQISTTIEDALPEGSGLILVVDDEVILRDTASAILQECGYDIIVAEDGLEAVEIFREKHADIKMVLLDMSMPKMSGKDAYLKMKEIQPELKTIMSSGFKQDERIQNVLELGVHDFIQKPYSVLELTKKVKKLIG
ncbi:MAG: response regulator [bacterium]|nr:response regulator [bacterium]